MGNSVKNAIKGDGKRQKKVLEQISFNGADEISAVENIDLEIKSEKRIYNNPEYDVIEAKIAQLERQKASCESISNSKSDLEELHKRAYGRIAKLKGNNRVTYKVQDNSDLKFEVVRADSKVHKDGIKTLGEVKSITMIRNGERHTLSATLDNYPGGDSSSQRQAMADKIDRVLLSGDYSLEEMEKIMELQAKAFEKEYARTQPARANYTKEFLAIDNRKASAGAEAEDISAQIAELRAKQAKLPAMSKEEGEKAFANMKEQDRTLATMGKSGLAR